MDVLEVLLGIAIVGGGTVALLVFLHHRDERAEERRSKVSTAHPPGEALALALSRMHRRGATVIYRDESCLTFQREKAPNQGLGCLLLLLGLVPGLLYFGLFGKAKTTTVVVAPDGGGSLVLLSGDDDEAREDLARHFKT